MSIRLRLLSILPKLMGLGLRRFNDLLREFPEAKTRSAVLKLYDNAGNQVAFWLGFEGDKPVVREVDPRNPPYATTEITMLIDVFIKILKGKLDFRAAYLYDLIDIKSNDGLPSSYHFLLWSAFFDRLIEMLK
ncbi:MAG: hypothetical protein DRJ38_04500 [Thermoprotei archaeon]|nr:MAG: hypothetical protein DRJ38_04500 [Thermoprotei archaeon]